MFSRYVAAYYHGSGHMISTNDSHTIQNDLGDRQNAERSQYYIDENAVRSTEVEESCIRFYPCRFQLWRLTSFSPGGSRTRHSHKTQQ
jgi:hypothetical protein